MVDACYCQCSEVLVRESLLCWQSSSFTRFDLGGTLTHHLFFIIWFYAWHRVLLIVLVVGVCSPKIIVSTLDIIEYLVGFLVIYPFGVSS